MLGQITAEGWVLIVTAIGTQAAIMAGVLRNHRTAKQSLVELKSSLNGEGNTTIRDGLSTIDAGVRLIASDLKAHVDDTAAHRAEVAARRSLRG